jgi:hypothetical protein
LLTIRSTARFQSRRTPKRTYENQSIY